MRQRPDSREAGVTLIELLVYMSLLTVVLTVVGGILISSTRTERDVRTAAEAANTGQLIVRSVQAGVRNASRVALTDSGGTQLLVVRTAGRSTPVEWGCQAWYYVPDGGGTLYTKRTSPAVKIPAPVAGVLDSWTLLGEGISATGSTVFEAVLGRVAIDLDMAVGDQEPISINSTATMRVLPNGLPKCFEE